MKLPPLPIAFERVEGLILFIGSIYFYFYRDGAIWPFVLLLLTPDISILAYQINNRVGAFVYNFFHTYSLPLIVLFVSRYLDSYLGTNLALIWFAHIAMDRMLGLGLKYSTGFKDTHLGKIGN